MTTPKTIGALLATGLLVTGVAHAQTARAGLEDASGRRVGQATLEQQGDGVQIRATFSELPPGTHAFHIHETGACAPPFESAGDHFNPTGKLHGTKNPRGPHAGDLPNIEASANGRVTVEAMVEGVALADGTNGLLDADGAALVVHERADDDRTDPAGNAGTRIACGVIRQ
jgi:Cu-Zn family superoxide dismutase